MRWSVLALFVPVFSSLLVFPPPRASASEFDDFRIPEHRWKSAGLGLEGLVGRQGFDLPVERNRSRHFVGRVFGNAVWAYDSDAGGHLFGVDGFAVGNGSDEEQTVTFGPSSDSKHDVETQSAAESWQVFVEARRNPWTTPLGFMGRTSIRGKYEQRWRDASSKTRSQVDTVVYRLEDSQDQKLWIYDYLIFADLSIGYGRVRDATGVYQVHLLIDRLERDGLLERSPSATARSKLAQIFYLQPNYSVPHDLPDRFFWGDVERVLREDGALGSEGLDALGAIHLQEPLPIAGGSFRRPAGFFTGPILRWTYRRSHLRFDASSTSSTFQDDSLVGAFSVSTHTRPESAEDLVLGGVTAEYHRPIGVRGQLDIRSLALFDLEGADVETSLESGAGYGYLVGERWFANAFARHKRQVTDRQFDVDRWSVEWGAGLTYFIEDRWSATLSVTDAQADQDGGFADQFQRSGRVSIGIDYRHGFFDAPGLIDPVRPLH